jgi:hypothetical protein
MSSTTSLTAWLQSHLSELYTAHSNDQLQSIINSTFTPSAEIIVNHDKVSRDSLLNNLQLVQVSGPGTTLEWKHITELSADQSNPTAVSVQYNFVCQQSFMRESFPGWDRRRRHSGGPHTQDPRTCHSSTDSFECNFHRKVRFSPSSARMTLMS